MKTKFSVEIHRSGDCNDAIVRMVTNHNEGKAEITLDLISAFCKCLHAQYPSAIDNVRTDITYPARTLEIWEKDKPTLTIKESDMPLTSTEVDLLLQKTLS